MLDKQITEFNENLLNLRDFVQQIEPIFLENSTKHDRYVKPIMILTSIDKLLSNSTELNESQINDLSEQKEKLKAFIKKLDDKLLLENDEKVEKKLTELPDTFELQGVELKGTNLGKWSYHFSEHKNYQSHINLLYKNALISLMSSAEWFFAQMLHFYYDKFPESSGINDKSLTLADLKKYASIAEAEKYLIEQKIENILRGNIESWFEYIKKDFKLGLSYIDNEIEEVIEISQRRNLFIHNGGIVNSIYLSKVNPRLLSKIKIGSKIPITKNYLDESIEKLQLLFTLVALELWKKLDPENIDRSTIMNDIIYENLLKERWNIARGFSFFILNDSKMPSEHKIVALLNNLLCRIRINTDKKVLEEVRDMDFSDKKEVYQLALLALKGENEKFFELLPSVLNSEQLSVENLEAFPIFSDIRKTTEYINFKASSIYFEKKNNKDTEDSIKQTISDSISITNNIADKIAKKSGKKTKSIK